MRRWNIAASSGRSARSCPGDIAVPARRNLINAWLTRAPSLDLANANSTAREQRTIDGSQQPGSNPAISRRSLVEHKPCFKGLKLGEELSKTRSLRGFSA